MLILFLSGKELHKERRVKDLPSLLYHRFMRQVSAWAETNHCTKNTVKERAPLESVYYCTYFSWVKHIYNKSMEWINKASRYVKRLLSFMKTIWQYCLTKTTSHTATIESVHQQIDRQVSGKLFYILELRHPLVFTRPHQAELPLGAPTIFKQKLYLNKQL